MSINTQQTDDCHAESNRLYGTVVSLTDSTLVTLTEDGREQTHSLVEHSRLVQRGRTCRAADVGAGARVKITTATEDQSVASMVECLRPAGST